MVYEIYFQTWVKEKFDLSSQDSLNLYNVAIQYPHFSGEEVYLARNMLDLYILDTLPTASHKSAKQTSVNSHINNIDANVFPNPANNELFIEFSRPLDGNGQFILYNIMGAEIMSYVMEKGTLLYKINLEPYKSGLYLYELRTEGKQLKKGKIIINK